MEWYWILLIVLAAVIVGFFLITMVVYYFNLDTKLIVKVLNPILEKHYDKVKRNKDI